MDYTGVDYETYSDVDLKTFGLDNYSRGVFFTPLIVSVADEWGEQTFDFVMDPEAKDRFRDYMERALRQPQHLFVAHNAGFERTVYHFLGMDIDDRIVDSAVYARMLGAHETLEMASRQLTNTPKLAVGKDLIQLFCVPNAHNKYSPPDSFMVLHYSEQWLEFIHYCEVDAKGSREIALYAEELFKRMAAPHVMRREDGNELVTWRQNQRGWHIDRPLVNQMANRAWANTIIEERMFYLDVDADLNFRSHQQVKAFAAKRGFKIKSTDKYHVPVYIEQLENVLLKDEAGDAPLLEVERKNYSEVLRMLKTKQELGGSSLSKLQKILELSNEHDQLRNQYVHVGAGQTYRTSGKGVQMQNLKKLADDVRDMETLYDHDVLWTNTDMADQLRQVFTAEVPDGEIIVGDFKAVESRALAYLAGEEWKLDAYRKGQDVYCTLVTRFEKYSHLTYEEVADKSGPYYVLRPRGKYSELSCGYQASAAVLQNFMFRLGFAISIDEAAENVNDWRHANPAISDHENGFWAQLDGLVKAVVREFKAKRIITAYGQVISIKPFFVESLQHQHPGAVSIMIQVWNNEDGQMVPIVNRIMHGLYFKGNSLCYYKPSENPGQLWTNLNKTESGKQKRDVLLRVYGGKLAGIITQSLCRELFFDSMRSYDAELQRTDNVFMVGQFHDEIASAWRPGQQTLDEAMAVMEKHMSESRLEGFPLEADIKHAFRYIK